jgi:amino acid permease
MDSHFFSFLPIFVFAFTCHQNIFAVYNELIDNSPKEVTKVVQISIGTALGVYQTIGILGYLTFGTNVQSNIVAMCNLLLDYHFRVSRESISNNAGN